MDTCLAVGARVFLGAGACERVDAVYARTAVQARAVLDLGGEAERVSFNISLGLCEVRVNGLIEVLSREYNTNMLMPP